MKILIFINSFPPEIRSASHLFFELAESLAIKGHKVTVVTKIPLYNIAGNKKPDSKYKGKLMMSEEMGGVKVLRFASIPLPRNIPLMRAFEEFYLSFVFFLRSVFLVKQDVALVYSPPLPLGLAAYCLKVFRGTPFIVNVQDIYPKTAIDLGLIKNKFLIGRAKALEKFVYSKADLITVHSEGNVGQVVAGGADREKVTVVPNCVDTGMIFPQPRMNRFRSDHGWNNDFIISFAGVIGFAQDLDAIIENAKIISGHKDIKFVLVGEGPAKSGLEEKVRDLKLDNVEFLPMQSREVYPQVLAASDICLVTLRRELKTPVVPGKIMSIMASGRPIVASVPLEGDAAKLIREANAGVAVEAGDSRALAAAILDMYRDRTKGEKMAVSARRYAEDFLSRSKCVEIYEELFLRITGK